MRHSTLRQPGWVSVASGRRSYTHPGGRSTDIGRGRRDRAANPLIKAADLAWLEFVKADLGRAAAFAEDFGFGVVERTRHEVVLRGTLSGVPCVIMRKGPKSRYLGAAFRAADPSDLARLSRWYGTSIRPLRDAFGGSVVDLRDPSGLGTRVVFGTAELPAQAEQKATIINHGSTRDRLNSPQRPPREPARVQRLGHVVLQTRHFHRDLDWYQQVLGMIVSDFLFVEDQPDRGPTMAFLRCDRGHDPVDHHTVAMHLGPQLGYVHSAYQVTDFDALAAGAEHLKHRGYRRVWGIGRHVQGSQIFDYWRDPDGLTFEHFTDGDLFDASVGAGWTPMSASGLSQWGPPVSAAFLGTRPSPSRVRDVAISLLSGSEVDFNRLIGLMKAMTR